ncbi:MAG: D-lyxose/D-mannose family sugar isomerase [Actinobacteria bacterium]|nr:D-lyxose/D-mannose family sugar isomerase [Actinomycetota bacterium]
MKRSEINRLIQSAEAFITERGFHLPPFAFWALADRQDESDKADEIRRQRVSNGGLKGA